MRWPATSICWACGPRTVTATPSPMAWAGTASICSPSVRTASRPWSRGATPSSIMPDWSSCPSMTWPPRCSLPAGSAPTISWPPPVSFWMPWLSRASRWRRRPPSPPAQPAQMPAELTQLSGWYGTSTAAAQLQITDEGVLTLTGMEGTFTYREDGSFRDESDSVLLKLVQEDNGGDLPLSEELRLHSRPDHPLCGLLRHGAPAQLPAGRGHSGRLGG